MKNLRMTGAAVAVASLIGAYAACAQDVPGLGIGGFAETRTEAKIGDETLGFTYFGARVKVRDERFLEAFVDIGMQSMDLKPYTADDKGAFGLGATVWLIRAEDELMLPADIGLYAAYYVADHTLTTDGEAPEGKKETDVKYRRFLVQGVVRAEGSVRPYLRAGIQSSKLDIEDETVLSNEGADEVKPAVNVGVEWSVSEVATLTLEGNYSESVGGAVHLDLWF